MSDCAKHVQSRTLKLSKLLKELEMMDFSSFSSLLSFTLLDCMCFAHLLISHVVCGLSHAGPEYQIALIHVRKGGCN